MLNWRKPQITGIPSVYHPSHYEIPKLTITPVTIGSESGLVEAGTLGAEAGAISANNTQEIWGHFLRPGGGNWMAPLPYRPLDPEMFPHSRWKGDPGFTPHYTEPVPPSIRGIGSPDILPLNLGGLGQAVSEGVKELERETAEVIAKIGQDAANLGNAVAGGHSRNFAGREHWVNGLHWRDPKISGSGQVWQQIARNLGAFWQMGAVGLGNQAAVTGLSEAATILGQVLMQTGNFIQGSSSDFVGGLIAGSGMTLGGMVAGGISSAGGYGNPGFVPGVGSGFGGGGGGAWGSPASADENAEAGDGATGWVTAISNKFQTDSIQTKGELEDDEGSGFYSSDNNNTQHSSKEKSWDFLKNKSGTTSSQEQEDKTSPVTTSFMLMRAQGSFLDGWQGKFLDDKLTARAGAWGNYDAGVGFNQDGDFDAHFKAELKVGAELSYDQNFLNSQYGDVNGKVTAFVGGELNADGKLVISPDKLDADLKGSAFVGGTVDGELGGDLKIDGHEVAEAKANLGISYGAGVQGEAKFGIDDSGIHLKLQGTAALGLGVSGGVDLNLNVGEIAKEAPEIIKGVTEGMGDVVKGTGEAIEGAGKAIEGLGDAVQGVGGFLKKLF